MTDETNVPAANSVPAEGQTTTTPETQAAEPGKPENETAVSTAGEQDAADTGEHSEASDDAETPQDQKPKRTRSERYKRTIETLRARVQELEATTTAAADAPKPPKAEDFQNYSDFEDARAAFNTDRAVTKALSETRKQESETRLAEARADLVEEFQEGIAAIKDRIPDYDAVTDACKVAPRADVADMILSSEKGPHLAYELAKNNGAKLREIQQLSPVEAARAIGRLEARLSLPSPKKTTQAPAPIKPVNGGASPTRDPASLANSEDVGDYINIMNERERKRA